MKNRTQPVLSVVVPLYNEAASLPHFFASLQPVLEGLGVPYEVIFVNDGSTDRSAEILDGFAAESAMVRVIALSRNFGKEVATTAGLHQAAGCAILMIDADGQHPVELIPEFLAAWRKGVKVVVGRRLTRKAGVLKRVGSRLFYSVFRKITGLRLDPDASDFRLIDQSVQAEFNKMTEHNRITRGLIDWLGYEREYIAYSENSRLAGRSPYSFHKLFRLAIDSAISLSTSPLYVTAYIGAVVLPLATLLGLGMGINWLLGDPAGLHATGGAYLSVLVLFLVGILLVSQGIIGLYLSHIHAETQNRPLYVVDATRSKGAK
jgi:glycosyltransferase involved in cell wall biosynthesis